MKFRSKQFSDWYLLIAWFVTSTPAVLSCNMFFELYWQYFVAGLIIYMIGRVGLVAIEGLKKKKKEAQRKKNDDYKTPDQSKC